MSSNPGRVRPRLSFASRNLSADCTHVVPGGEVRIAEMDGADALLRLRAFAGQPSVNLVQSDALIYLGNADTKLAVQNENGRLFATRVPEAAHAAVEQTPEEIVSSLEGMPADVAQGRPPRAAGSGAVRRRTWRARLGTGWIAGGLAVVAAVASWFSFSTGGPADIEIISDPGRIAGLHRTFNGRYGAAVPAGGTVLQINSGRLTVLAGEELLLDLGYRYGRRGSEVVLLVANGAVIEPQGDGGLKFNGSVYPRIGVGR